IVLALVAVRLATSRPSAIPSAGETTEGEPAKVEPLGQGGLHRVVLTARAAERLGVQTGTVRDAEIAGETVVPFAAVIYDVHGATWVYANPAPLTFVRHGITVDRIDGDRALLAMGPPAGTKVVTVGVAELFGTEFGGLVEQ